MVANPSARDVTTRGDAILAVMKGYPVLTTPAELTAYALELAALGVHIYLVGADLALLMDPKLSDEQMEAMWDSASPEVQAAARPVAQSVIEHGKAAARLSGEASTARMFDRDDAAEQFDEQAEEERGKALRLVDALRAALTDVKTQVSEGVHDTVSGDGSTVGGGFMGAIRDFASETGAALREGVSETADAVGDGLTETVEALAEGVGIGVPEVGHGESSPDGGDVGDGPERDDEHDGESSGEDTDQHVAAAEHMDGDSGEDTAADDSDDGDGDAEDVDSDDTAADQSAPSTIASPRQAHAQAPARGAGTATAEAVDGDSVSAGREPAQVKGRTDSQSTSKDESKARTPSTRATAGRTPAPGMGSGHGVTPKPQPQPVRGVKAEPTAGVMGTPQKTAGQTFDVTKLSDSELLSFIARLYEKLRA